MANQACAINEILYYLLNNLSNLNNEFFFISVSDFYNNEEIVTAKKTLILI